MLNLERMSKSKDKVDKRFMTILKIKKAQRLGMTLFDEQINTNVIPDLKEP